MPPEDRDSTPAGEADIVDEETSLTREQASVLATIADPATLVRTFRGLQQRIPGFTQLTRDEVQSMLRVAYLDPEFVERVLHGAAAWDELPRVLSTTPEALREESEDIARLESLVREMRVFLKGVDGAIVSRRHRLHTTILEIYSMVGTLVRDPRHSHLRPYYEDMKRAWTRRRKKAAKKDKPE